jgi:hypothetical protein
MERPSGEVPVPQVGREVVWQIAWLVGCRIGESAVGFKGCAGQRGARFLTEAVMNRSDAYLVLSRELNAWREIPYGQLVKFIDEPMISRSARIGEDIVAVTVRVRWADAKRRRILIEATADGPSCWRLERLEESILIAPDEPG